MIKQVDPEVRTLETSAITYKGRPVSIKELAAQLIFYNETTEAIQKDITENVKAPENITKQKIMQEVRLQKNVML